MIFKPFGSEVEEQINVLKKLFKDSKSEAQRKLIKSDLIKLENGYKAEKENAYYIDFEFKNSNNIIVLHDIRIEHNGRTAQIDHILLSRVEVTLLESKSFSGHLNIKEDGSLLVQYNNSYKTLANPIEQNKRHLLVLKDFINSKFELPQNTKIFGGISFQTKVLINPKTVLMNKTLPEGYERADSYISRRNNEIDKVSGLNVLKLASTMMSMDKVKELAKFLMMHHTPIKYDYSKKYPIKSTTSSYVREEPIRYNQPKADLLKYSCSKCNSRNLEVAYGRNYYFKCLDCGNNIPIKHTCNTPNCKPKTKKKKLQFFKVCELCGIDELFWENKKP